MDGYLMVPTLVEKYLLLTKITVSNAMNLEMAHYQMGIQKTRCLAYPVAKL